jgi:hypothetical protein
MGVDYTGVGGIGIEVDDKVLATFIENKVFSEEEWDEYGSECLEEIGVPYQTAGSAYSGEETNYLFVPGDTLGEIQANAPKFIETLKKHGCNISEKDLLLISDLHVW